MNITKLITIISSCTLQHQTIKNNQNKMSKTMSELMSEIMNIHNAKDQEIAALKKNAESDKCKIAALEQELMTNTTKFCSETKYECECGSIMAKFTPALLDKHKETNRHVAFLSRQLRSKTESVANECISEENIAVIIDPTKKKQNNYNKEYNAKCRRNCECGGKTSTIKRVKKDHDESAKHIKYVLSQIV